MLAVFPKMISIAPMMGYTDRHCRYFLRQLSKHVLLYTEMIHARALLKGDRDHLLKYHPQEHPVAIQLGGSIPHELQQAAQVAAEYGYDEINLNVGCPSDRVQTGQFGACLMAKPQLVADCIYAMQKNISIPVTVKTRIGIDDHDSYTFLHEFISIVSQAGCTNFIIHARKAWLKGLSPKQNREIPPLDYERVYQLKRDFPHLRIMINGGIKTCEEINQHLYHCDGVMLGRVVYENPYLIASIDKLLKQINGVNDATENMINHTSYFNDVAPSAIKTLSRKHIIERMLPYLTHEIDQGTPAYSIMRHLLGLFHGQPGARNWRRSVTEHANIEWLKSFLIQQETWL